MTDPITILLDAITRDPADRTAWLALADALDEANRPEAAELARLRESLRFRDRLDPERPSEERRLQELLASNVEPVGPAMTLTMPNGVPMEFRLIPPGTFWIGSPPDERGRLSDEIQQCYTVERGFWLAMTPMTRAQAGVGKEDTPWIGGHREMRDQVAKMTEHWQRLVRLPGEGEWEYACRAGTTSPCHGGDLIDMPSVAWCSTGADRHIYSGATSVASLISNAWGLYDMHGNVREATTALNSPHEIILRGGSWRCLPSRCRSASRLLVSTRYPWDLDDVGVRFLIELK